VAILYSDLLNSSLNFPLLPSYKAIDIVSRGVLIPTNVPVSIIDSSSTSSASLRSRYPQLVPFIAFLPLLIVRLYRSLIDAAAD
jgi:hypothetical protein